MCASITDRRFGLVKNNNTGTYLIQRIIGIKISYNDNGFNSNIITRRVLQTEMQDYFTIGVSSIEVVMLSLLDERKL
jgi:hypothetical protein